MKLGKSYLGAMIIAVGAVLAGPALAGENVPRNGAGFDAAVRRAAEEGAAFLLSRLGPDGRCLYEPSPDHPHFGALTAMSAAALLSGVVDHRQPALAEALYWLSRQELGGSRAVAWRAIAFSRVDDDRIMPVLRRDVSRLIQITSGRGCCGQGLTALAPGGAYDNLSSFLAVQAVWAGAGRGLSPPEAFWRRVYRHWTDQQQIDGGWGYRLRRGALRTRSYGSMTAAGMAVLQLSDYQLRGEHYAQPRLARENEHILAAVDWLDENFSADVNPRKGINYYYEWLHAISLAGRLTGYGSFAGQDWRRVGAAALLASRRSDGSWGVGDRVAETALAVMFLTGGQDPVVVRKLKWPGKWNARPHDMANFTRYVSRAFERPVGWRILDLKSLHPGSDVSPILYISGAGPCEMTDQQLARLREFVYRGGMIVSEAAHNNADFTMEMRSIYARLFPEYPLGRLSDDHPVYALHFSLGQITGLWGITNGVRLLAVHSPRDLSLGLQGGGDASNRPSFELLANIALLATDFLPAQSWAADWPEAEALEPGAIIRVARLAHGGNCDPEPLAWQRLRRLLARRHGVALEVSEPMPITSLDAADRPIAVMTGTESFRLSGAELAALDDYFDRGGRLIIDAAGGARAFAEAALEQIAPLAMASAGRIEPLPDELVCDGPEPIGRVGYRRDYASTLPRLSRRRHRLQGIYRGERLVVVFNAEDLTAGLLGCPIYRVRGYSPPSAAAIMTNLLCNLADVAGSAKLAQRPSEQSSAR